MQILPELPYPFCLGVRFNSPDERPARETVLKAAAAATAAGFEVLYAGRFGLTVRASAACVKEALGVDVPATVQRFCCQTSAADERPLTQFIDFIEIAPPPTLLASKPSSL